MSELPDNICRISTLKTLRVSNNRMTELPRNLARLKSLRELTVSHNRLVQLPAVIAAMPELAHLALDGNVCLPNSLPPGLLQVCIRQHTYAYGSIRMLTYADVC